MFVAIIVIILGACIFIVGSMYFNTISMQKTYGSVNGYYGAYYGAMASIERGLLMSKIKYPTYQGSGGFKGDNIYGAASNGFSGEFWKLAQGNNSMTRNVNSKTNKIEGVIDTKTLRLISFNTYQDDDTNAFSGGTLGGTYGINDGLSFTGTTEPRTFNLGRIPETKTGRGESTDFNRFFSLKNKEYIVRGLNTTDTYGEGDQNQEYDREGEKDFQLTGEFNFTRDACNPRPALSGELGNYYNCN